MIDESGGSKIEAQLSVIVKLLSVLVTQNKVQRDQIGILAKAGLNRNQIAEIVGTTPGTVSVEISNMKKKVAKGKLL